LYEAGRFQEVVNRTAGVSAGDIAPADAWFAAHSYLDLRREAEARALFERLGASEDPAWRAAAGLALAVLNGNIAEIDAARAAAAAYPAQTFVQYELGIAHMTRGALQEAAAALDRSAAGVPTLAHAYYYAGLAYQKLDRVDLMATRFESFLRLAPRAPQRPEVEAIMRTIRG
jgi:tetratricopeptide (TPR) repeat protein